MDAKTVEILKRIYSTGGRDAGKGVAAYLSDMGNAKFLKQFFEPGKTIGARHFHGFEHGENILLGRELSKNGRFLR